MRLGSSGYAALFFFLELLRLDSQDGPATMAPSCMANGDSLAFVPVCWLVVGHELETWQRLACLYPSHPSSGPGGPG